MSRGETGRVTKRSKIHVSGPAGSWGFLIARVGSGHLDTPTREKRPDTHEKPYLVSNNETNKLYPWYLVYVTGYMAQTSNGSTNAPLDKNIRSINAGESGWYMMGKPIHTPSPGHAPAYLASAPLAEENCPAPSAKKARRESMNTSAARTQGGGARTYSRSAPSIVPVCAL